MYVDDVLLFGALIWSKFERFSLRRQNCWWKIKFLNKCSHCLLSSNNFSIFLRCFGGDLSFCVHFFNLLTTAARIVFFYFPCRFRACVTFETIKKLCCCRSSMMVGEENLAGWEFFFFKWTCLNTNKSLRNKVENLSLLLRHSVHLRYHKVFLSAAGTEI